MGSNGDQAETIIVGTPSPTPCGDRHHTTWPSADPAWLISTMASCVPWSGVEGRWFHLFFSFFNVKPNENLVHLEILWYYHVLKDALKPAETCRNLLKPAETCWSRIWWIYDGSSTVQVKSTDLSVPCVPEACFGSFDCPGLGQIMVFTWFLCGSSWPGAAIDVGRVAPGFTSLKCSGWRWTSTFHLCLRTQ